jgi:predicted secreted protein
MTSAISGMEGSFWVCATESGTYVKLAELIDCKLKISGAEIDTSNVDDSGWGSSIAGARSWEVSANNNFIVADPAYILMIAAQIANSDVWCMILTDGTPTSSPVGWKGKGGISTTDIDVAGTQTQQKVAWTIKSRGALAAAT